MTLKLGASNARFICFEGCDSVGKTTLAERVAAVLNERGYPIVFVPRRDANFAAGDLGDRLNSLRKILWDYPTTAPIQAWGDFHWFHLLVSWFSLWDKVRIQPLLKEGRWVVVDGWVYKYIARFRLKPDFPRDYIQNCFAHISMPETVLLLDVDPCITVLRQKVHKATESGGLDGLTGKSQSDFINYQNLVRANLRQMATEQCWHVIIDTVSETLLTESAIELLLNNESDHDSNAQHRRSLKRESTQNSG